MSRAQSQRKSSGAFLAVLALCACAWIGWMMIIPPVTAQRISAPAHDPVVPSIEPSEEQVAFAYQVLMPIIGRRWFDKDGPSPQESCSKGGTWDSNEPPPLSLDPVTRLQALAYTDQGNIFLVVDVLRDLHARRERENNLWLFEDEVMIAIVHECLHVSLGHGLAQNPSVSELARSEQEAWYETAKRYLVPLRQAGHLRGLKDDTVVFTVLQVWDLTGGDSTDPAWARLGRESVSPDAR